MSLSNPRKYLCFALFCAGLAAGCGARAPEQQVPATAVEKQVTRFPFSRAEPEIYQADVMTSGGGLRSRWFIARKGERSRVDFFAGDVLSHSRFSGERVDLVDHARRIYCSLANSESGNAAADFSDDIVRGFFRGVQFTKFEEIGRVAGITQYRVGADQQAKADIVVDVEDATGVIVRQAFSDEGEVVFQYEVQNLSTSVEDGVFVVPADFRPIACEEFFSRRQK